MRGAHATRAVLLMISYGLAHGVASGDDGRASPVSVNGLAEFEPATMPGGLAGLCRREPVQCAAGPAGAIDLPSDAMDVLTAVNQGVNHRIAATTDRSLYGKDEYWAIPTTAGDCEDFVLLKRQMLMRLGISQRELLITVVHDENGEGHAVLTVPMPDGDVVLDNRRDEILHWWETGYTFIKRQSRSDPARWVSLGREKLQATDIASGPGLP